MKVERCTVAADGARLVATFYAPTEPPRGAVLVVAAMGVTQRYYAAFARWLAANGYLAATFDFRGVGESRNGSLRGLSATIFDWAERDCSSMLEALADRAAGAPLYWVGHSLGGQVVPFVRGAENLRRVVTVASGSGYWAIMTRPRRWLALYLWHVVVPAALALFGFFPGRRLRKVGDLPKGVAEQWRRWCLNPEYAVGAEGAEVRKRYEAVRVPITALSFADDEMMSERSTAELHGQYANAERRIERIAPSDIGVKRIGHFGFFLPKFEASLWRERLLPELG